MLAPGRNNNNNNNNVNNSNINNYYNNGRSYRAHYLTQFQCVLQPMEDFMKGAHGSLPSKLGFQPVQLGCRLLPRIAGTPNRVD